MQNLKQVLSSIFPLGFMNYGLTKFCGIELVCSYICIVCVHMCMFLIVILITCLYIICADISSKTNTTTHHHTPPHTLSLELRQKGIYLLNYC